MKSVHRHSMKPFDAHEPQPPAPADDESFVVDDRANLSPSDHVQSKLLRLLPVSAIPVSCMHTHRDTRRAVVK